MQMIRKLCSVFLQRTVQSTKKRLDASFLSQSAHGVHNYRRKTGKVFSSKECAVGHAVSSKMNVANAQQKVDGEENKGNNILTVAMLENGFKKYAGPYIREQLSGSSDRWRQWVDDKSKEFNEIIAMADADYDFKKARGSDEFLAQYHAISNKLKKRFLRKPNVTEASDQFSALATQCELRELWQYAGLCWLAAARCQGTLGNNPSEANLLARAGRQFLIAEKKNDAIGCPSPGQENIQATVSCFGHSLARSNTQPGSSMASAGLAMELAVALGTNPAGAQQLRRAISIHPTAQALSMLATSQIKQGDYVTALNVLTELVELIEANVGAGNTPSGNNSDILHRCEVSRVLLLLILQITPQRLPPSLAQLLEKYAWVEETTDEGLHMDEDELLLMQSLVLACQSQDHQALLDLEGELWPYLDAEQKELLRKLVRTLANQ